MAPQASSFPVIGLGRQCRASGPTRPLGQKPCFNRTPGDPRTLQVPEALAQRTDLCMTCARLCLPSKTGPGSVGYGDTLNPTHRPTADVSSWGWVPLRPSKLQKYWGLVLGSPRLSLTLMTIKQFF